MSRPVVLFLLLLLGACKFQVPLDENTQLPLDTRVPGQWRQVSPAGDGSDGNKRALILPYTDTEYLIVYYSKGKGLYFRGYPVRFEGRDYVQLQFIGISDGVIEDRYRKYDVLHYELDGDRLSAWLLNGDVIDKDIESIEAFREAFRQEIGNRDLFKKTGEFVRMNRTAATAQQPLR